MINPITLSVIRNAVGFEYISQTEPERIDGDSIVDINDDEFRLISAIADRVYEHLSSGKFLYE